MASVHDVGCAEFLQGGVDACDFVDLDLDALRIIMILCDDAEKPIPFVVERIRANLGRVKVSTDRSDPETTPVYFKSRYSPQDDPGREAQLEIAAAMAATFTPGAPEPKWPDVKSAIWVRPGRLIPIPFHSANYPFADDPRETRDTASKTGEVPP